MGFQQSLAEFPAIDRHRSNVQRSVRSLLMQHRACAKIRLDPQRPFQTRRRYPDRFTIGNRGSFRGEKSPPEIRESPLVQSLRGAHPHCHGAAACPRGPRAMGYS